MPSMLSEVNGDNQTNKISNRTEHKFQAINSNFIQPHTHTTSFHEIYAYVASIMPCCSFLYELYARFKHNGRQYLYMYKSGVVLIAIALRLHRYAKSRF